MHWRNVCVLFRFQVIKQNTPDSADTLSYNLQYITSDWLEKRRQKNTKCEYTNKNIKLTKSKHYPAVVNVH